MFFISNNTLPFNSEFSEFRGIFGINSSLLNILMGKVECNLKFDEFKLSFAKFNWKKKRLINIIIAKIFNINFGLIEVIKLNVLRTYLVGSFKGRKTFLNKPVRGQRTRSNSNTNNHLAAFLRNKMKYLLKMDNPSSDLNKNFFIKIKKKTKRRSIKIRKESKLNALLAIKTWS